MASDFWAKALGVTQSPPGVAMPAPTTPATAGAWWQPTPVATHVQVPPQQGHQTDSAPQDYRTLKAMRAEEMSAEQMEALAEIELAFQKYHNECPNCQSTNFLPHGTRVGNVRMGTDKCFDCGASSSTLTASPEPAVGGSGGKAGRATKQTVHGGQGTTGRHHSQLPVQYLPRQ